MEPKTPWPYLTTIERLAISRTEVKCWREMVVEVLAVRFGSVPDEVVDRLNGIDELPQLKQLHQQAILIESLSAFQALI